MAQIAVIGQVVFDEIVMKPTSGSSGSHVGYRLGGKAFNIAIALSRLGVTPAIVSAVGSDTIGDKAKSVLESRNVDISYLKTCSTSFGGSVATPQVRLVSSPNGERRAEMGDERVIDRCYSASLRDLPAQHWDAVIFTLEMLPALYSDIARAIDAARSVNPDCQVVALASGFRNESVGESMLELLGKVNLLTMNRREAAYLLAMTSVPSNSHEVPLALNKLCGVPRSCVTFGREGWAWASDADFGTQALEVVEPVDVIGANDVFTAALATEIVGGRSLRDATLTGAYAARISVERTGGSERFPTRSELERAIATGA